MLNYGLTKSYPQLGVLDTKFECTQCHPTAAGRNIYPAYFDAVHHLIEPATKLTAQQIVLRNTDAVHNQFGGVNAFVAHFLDLARNR